MAKKKRPCFLLERDQKTIIDELDNEEAGKIFKAIYEYETTGEEPKLDRALKLVFKQFKVKLDFYDNEYEEKCKTNKKNIEKYWEKVKDTNEYDRIQTNTTATNKNKINKNKIKKEKEKKECVKNTLYIPDTHDTIFEFSCSAFENYEKNDLEKSCKKFFNYYNEKKWKGVNDWQEKLKMWIEDDFANGKIKVKQKEEYDTRKFFEDENGLFKYDSEGVKHYV